MSNTLPTKDKFFNGLTYVLSTTVIPLRSPSAPTIYTLPSRSHIHGATLQTMDADGSRECGCAIDDPERATKSPEASPPGSRKMSSNTTHMSPRITFTLKLGTSSLTRWETTSTAARLQVMVVRELEECGPRKRHDAMNKFHAIHPNLPHIRALNRDDEASEMDED
ncbi:hypothetical protein B0T16DRAFT_447610 [Cercophora newfieldiana]|uniref:Uncharacterized protein n=1 Tax=Cercophora newfieldiana TaxID=92897 RepID=A0AA39Y257_9PEZI|nr:hypothetical protein B0T16DRAFT_447610 [Cercophora newfieldiana]